MPEFYISSTKFTLQERETKRNGKVYDVVFRVIDPKTARDKQKKLSGFKTKTAAKDAYNEYIAEHCQFLKNAQKILSDRIAEASDTQIHPTLAEAMEQYIKAINNQNKESSIVTKISRYKMFVIPYFGTKRMDEITVKELYEWQDYMWNVKKRDGMTYNDAYCKAVRNSFASFFRWYCERNEIICPFDRVKPPKSRARKTEMQFWTREQFERFISYADDPLYHAFFMTLFFTGRRIGEVMALSPSDVGTDSILFSKTYSRKTRGGTYNITTTKNEKKDRTLICPTLARALKEYKPAPDAKFYFGGDRPLPEQSIRNQFNKYCGMAGLEPIRLHDLRHSFVSMCIHQGANMMVVASLIGDTVEQVMKTYGHLYDSDKKKIIMSL